MSHPILSELPYESQSRSFEEEVASLERHLSTESKRAALVRLGNVLLDLKDLGDSVPLRRPRRSHRR